LKQKVNRKRALIMTKRRHAALCSGKAARYECNIWKQ